MIYKFGYALNSIQTKGNQITFHVESSLFTSVIIFLCAFFTLLSRIGFETSYYNFFAITGISLLLSNFSTLYFFLSSKMSNLRNEAVIILLLLLITVAASFLPNFLKSVLVFTFSIIGFLSVPLLIMGISKSLSLGKGIALLILPTLLMIWLLGQMYKLEIHHPLFLEKIAMGISNLDQLFHASISEMIKSYGIPSTGLYGTPFLHYHFGSHYILARFSALFQVSSLEVYNFAYIIIFIPLYFRTALVLVINLAETFAEKETRFRPDWLFWMMFVLFNVTILPDRIKNKFALFDSWIVSESYLFSLIFLFLSISIGITVFAKGYKKSVPVIEIFLLAITLLLVGLSKVSTLFVVVIPGIYLIIRCRLWKSPIVWILGILLLPGIYFLMKVATPTTSGSAEGGLHVLKSITSYTDEQWRFLFVFVYFIFLIIYAAARVNFLDVKHLGQLIGKVKSRKLIDLEFLLLIAVTGFIPAAVLVVGSGSAFYFSDVQIRLSIFFLAAWVLFLRREGAEFSQDRLFTWIKKNLVISSFVGLLFLGNVYTGMENYLNTNLILRMSMLAERPDKCIYYSPGKDFYAYLAGNPKDLIPKIKEIAFSPSFIYNENKYYGFYKWLTDTSRYIMPKNQYYIGISKTDPFWKTANILPEAIPFILPALTGMAESNGLPENFKQLNMYGYVYYHDIGAIDTLNCKPIPGKKILMLVPNQHSIYPCN